MSGAPLGPKDGAFHEYPNQNYGQQNLRRATNNSQKSHSALPSALQVPVATL
jgi:hypothetical protein